MNGLKWFQCLRCGRREEGWTLRCPCGARCEEIPDPEGYKPPPPPVPLPVPPAFAALWVYLHSPRPNGS